MPRLYLFLILITLLSFSLAQQVTVQPGDTLWELAERYDTTIEAILSTNDLTGTDLLPGAVLTLPGGTQTNTETQTYTVRNGDTLYDIAAAYSMTVDELLAVNNIDGAIIRPGQTLKIRETAAPPEPLVVTVAPGDSLWRIAKGYGTTVDALVAANGLADSVVDPGQKLTIPGRYAATTSADQGGTTPPTIEVSRGDTLWEIAERYNTTVPTLMSANELTSQQIRAGQVLRIVSSNDIVKAGTAAETMPLTTAMVWPLTGVITSKFGYRQLRISGSNFHTGLDIDGNTGDVIVAAAPGVVTYSGWRSGYGNLVIIRGDSAEYYYGHAAELWVSAGTIVEAGQAIATVGNTGRSTGSHLHFEIRVDGAPIDPLLMLEQYATSP